MMHWQRAERFHVLSQAQWMLLGLSLVLVMLFAHLLSMGVASTRLVTMAATLPLVVASYFLLCRARASRYMNARYINTGLAMFALGGVGMLLGCMQDFGPLGLYGLLSLCQTYTFNPGDLAGYWQKIQLSPWTYAGMWLGGNLGMLLMQRDNRIGLRTRPGLLSVILVCNLGMVLGMLAGEVLVTALVSLPWPAPVAGSMVLTMLLSMSVGMLLALWGLDYFVKAKQQ